VSQLILPELTSASRKEHEKSKTQRGFKNISRLLGLLELTSAHLLRLQILVQEEQRRLVGLGGAHDGKHALTSLIVRCLWFTRSAMFSRAQNEGEGEDFLPWQ
jgi:hypothetical protein